MDNRKIWKFIEKQTVLTLATSVDNTPYCCSCFYVFEKENKILIFQSKSDTKHAADLKVQPKVAGSILPDLSKLGEIKGIQFVGETMPFTDENRHKKLAKLYYKKYPFARAMKGEFHFVELNFVKMTDNKLGIGKKRIWNKKQA